MSASLARSAAWARGRRGEAEAEAGAEGGGPAARLVPVLVSYSLVLVSCSLVFVSCSLVLVSYSLVLVLVHAALGAWGPLSRAAG